VIWPLLLRYGLFEWGTLTKIAKEIGVHRSTVCRHRARIFKAMLGP
jgi:DNA-directed RNA polymerase specialized sigma subunit